MKNKTIFLLGVLFLTITACSPKRSFVIYLPENAGTIEKLAAKEIRKYIYLRSDRLPKIQMGLPEKQVRGWAIILNVDVLLEEQEFRLKSYVAVKDKILRITGGSPQALLYAAYEFAEQLGVRFYLHGDVIPDKKITFWLPDLDIQKKPLFDKRGILPFHDFPEGPDWWNEQEYKAVVAQLPKLKMNFIGFHTYPWRTDFNGEGPKSEPLVWIGREEAVNADGTVQTAYPVLHFQTGDSTWGYSPAPTSDFLSGASQLFEVNNFGADYMKNLSPWPRTEVENIRIFNESGRVFSSAFTLARTLGVKICVGTETPLIFPENLRLRYGIKSNNEAEIKALYRGMFSRIQRTYPIDYYWLWTPESWTWSSVEDKTVADAKQDLQIAYDVLKEMGSPFTLATCGWVLGPPNDRTEFDRVLPKDMPFSCINRGLGYTPVDKGFGAISGRSKWSIPWMEDDPDLITVQLWAGRMRKDALDSWKYGCDGLFGIHWRTRSIGPTVSALARAAWDCDKFDTVGTGRDLSVQRDLPVEDFYTDWVQSEFGMNDPRLVRIFADLDSKGSEIREGYKGDAPLNASDWIRGPGGLMVNRDLSDIEERIERYDFIPDLEALRGSIAGAGNLERFDYWLNAFRFNKAVLEVTRTQIELDHIIKRIGKENNKGLMLKIATDEALPKRIELAEKWESMNRILLSFVSTTGELGTIANLEMHNIRKNENLTGHDDLLKSILKTDLPGEAEVSKEYSGKTRVVLTSHPSILEKDEDFYLRIRVLSEDDDITGKLFYKRLGGKDYSEVETKRLASNVFEVRIPADAIPDDFEYYIEMSAGKEKVMYPAMAGDINLVVVKL
jgi:hypothetical protein